MKTCCQGIFLTDEIVGVVYSRSTESGYGGIEVNRVKQRKIENKE